MADRAFFKAAFDALATDGYIGDPSGKPAYAYLRVSSAGQAEEGRGGLPRQIQNIHEIAAKTGLKIGWDMVFADDHTGFEFENRPELSKLRKEYKSATPRAKAIVMEYLDRLSRNADWHQGYLLDEMQKNGIKPVFWKSFSSRIERAVMGATSQDGMEDSLERMKRGVQNKARSGRITARQPAYGYRLVDKAGEQIKVARETYYAIDKRTEDVVRCIFQQIASGETTADSLATQLNARGVPAPRKGYWRGAGIQNIIHNPLYKGEFAANRLQTIVLDEFNRNGKKKRKHVERPESEWIKVIVPAIVDPQTWEQANRNLLKNKRTARRNGNEGSLYLLTGLVRCAACGRAVHGQRRRTLRYYGCYSIRASQHKCLKLHVHCAEVDSAVWHVVSRVLLDPALLVKALDERFNGQDVQAKKQEIAYLETQIENTLTEEAKLKKAYLADAFTPEEFAAERHRLVGQRETFSTEIRTLQSQIMTPDELAAQKAALLNIVGHARQFVDLDHDIPDVVKRAIIRQVVDEVVLSSDKTTFMLRGAFGTWETLVRLKTVLRVDEVGHGFTE